MVSSTATEMPSRTEVAEFRRRSKKVNKNRGAHLVALVSIRSISPHRVRNMREFRSVQDRGGVDCGICGLFLPKIAHNGRKIRKGEIGLSYLILSKVCSCAPSRVPRTWSPIPGSES
jgi:hypothetical protein